MVVTSNQPQNQAPPSQQQSPPIQTAPQQHQPHQMQSRGAPRGRGMMPRGMNRGRGGYNQGPPRQQFDTRQPSNTTTVTPIKRGGMGGPPGPKRGRFEQGPPSRHHMNPPPMAPHPNSYNNMQPV